MTLMKKIIFIIFLFVIILCYCVFVEPYWIKINKITILDKDIPILFNNKKIVFIADIHHGPDFSIQRVQKIVKKINSFEPDIVLLGGDYVDQDEKYIKPVFDELSKINAKYFIGGVLGNHDHWESQEKSLLNMTKAKIENLDNKSKWIHINNEKIKIGGVGDLWQDKQVLENTTDDVLKSDFVILVSHNPDYFQKILNNKIDLVLSGHTHGGQITFFGLLAPVLPIQQKNQWKGIYSNKYSKLIITKGIGTTGLPIRFFSRPEIIVLELKNSE
jgi:uncharacterized protein